MVDAPLLGSGGVTHGGSSPLFRTKEKTMDSVTPCPLFGVQITGAGGGTRTRTVLLPKEFKSFVSDQFHHPGVLDSYYYLDELASNCDSLGKEYGDSLVDYQYCLR